MKTIEEVVRRDLADHFKLHSSVVSLSSAGLDGSILFKFGRSLGEEGYLELNADVCGVVGRYEGPLIAVKELKKIITLLSSF